MTDNLPATTGPFTQPASQATAIEQASRVAEVQARVTVAQAVPRDINRAQAAMREVCSTPALAQRAFFSYPKAGETVEGPSIKLAEELARVWGNLEFGLSELRRDDETGESEMMAFAWDVQHNTRTTRTFIVKHAIDTRRGRKRLSELRDITANNNNFGGRAMRECIYKVLPSWFREDAERLCRETLASQASPEKITAMVTAYDKAHVPVEQLEAKVGRSRSKWTPQDYAQLTTLYQSLVNREITRDEAFPEPESDTLKALEAQAAADGPMVTAPTITGDDPWPQSGESLLDQAGER